MRPYLGHILLDQLSEKVQPASTAVIVVDMQNDFVHPDGYCVRSMGFRDRDGSGKLIESIDRLLAGARQARVRVYYSKVVQLPDGSLASPVWLADNLRIGFEPLHCMRGTWGWEVIEELAPVPGDTVFEKTRRSCFQGTNLENLLRARGIRSLIVTGVAASGCVEWTVRDAIERDYFVVVPRDCIYNGSAERTRRSYAAFERLLAPEDWTTTDELLATWEGARAPTPVP